MARFGFVFGLAGIACAFLSNGATASGLAPIQSDSACAAFVPGWQTGDYVRSCARLIERLKDAQARCEALKPEDARTDPQNLCANLSQIKSHLAAALNDRAYFLILSRGSANYREAINDLDYANNLLDRRYWLAIRNRAVARMLLGEFALAKADFVSVAQAVSERDPAAAGTTLVRPSVEAEVRLGLGFANLGLCDAKAAQEQLVDAERLALGPVGADVWVRAAAMFGQGLALKVKGAVHARAAATSPDANERGRYERYGRELTEQGAVRMAAASALAPSIRQDIADRFSIEEATTIATCRGNPNAV